MVEPNTIPELMDSNTYDESVVAKENLGDPIFLEHAIFLHDHGYHKDMSILELRDKLRDLYRKSKKMRDTNDVWK